MDGKRDVPGGVCCGSPGGPRESVHVQCTMGAHCSRCLCPPNTPPRPRVGPHPTGRGRLGWCGRERQNLVPACSVIGWTWFPFKSHSSKGSSRGSQGTSRKQAAPSTGRPANCPRPHHCPHSRAGISMHGEDAGSDQDSFILGHSASERTGPESHRGTGARCVCVLRHRVYFPPKCCAYFDFAFNFYDLKS